MSQSILCLCICALCIGTPVNMVRAESDRWTSPGPFGFSSGLFEVSAVNPGLQIVMDTKDIYLNEPGNDCWLRSSTLPEQNIHLCDRSPWETDEIYIAGLNHLWRSRDAGLSWIDLTPSESFEIDGHYAIDPFLNGHIVCESACKIMESFDAGLSWVQGNSLPSDAYCDVLQIFPQHPDSFLVKGSSLLVTTDRGLTWRQVPDPDANIWGETAGYDRTIWGIGEENLMYRYSIEGQNWNSVSTPDAAIACFAVDRSVNRIWLATESALYRTTDQGVTWDSVLQMPDIRAIAAAGDGILVHSLNNLYLSIDGGVTFSLRTCGLTGVSIDSVDLSAASGAWVATSDHYPWGFVFLRNALTSEWECHESPSGIDVIRFDQSDSDRLIALGDTIGSYSWDLQLMVSEDSGQSFHPFEENLNELDNTMVLHRPAHVDEPLILSSIYDEWYGCNSHRYGCASVALRWPGSTCWEIISNTHDLMFYGINRDAANPSIWYAHGGIRRGYENLCDPTDIQTGFLYRSEDSGRTWTGFSPEGSDETRSVEAMVQCLNGSPLFLYHDRSRIYLYDSLNNRAYPREELDLSDQCLFPLDSTGQDYIYSQNKYLHRSGRYANFGTKVAFGELTAEEYHQDLSDPFHIFAANASHRSVQEIRLSGYTEDLPVPTGVLVGQNLGVIEIRWTALPDLGVKLYLGNAPGQYSSCFSYGPDRSSADIDSTDFYEMEFGIPVYIRLTHYNRAGCESAYSEEYKCVPGEEYPIVKAGGCSVESYQDHRAVKLTVYARSKDDGGQISNIRLFAGGMESKYSYFRDDGKYEDDVAGDSIYTESFELPDQAPPGIYFYQIKAYDNQGFYTDSWPLLRVRDKK